jgi:hypothetical protein
VATAGGGWPQLVQVASLLETTRTPASPGEHERREPGEPPGDKGSRPRPGLALSIERPARRRVATIRGLLAGLLDHCSVVAGLVSASPSKQFASECRDVSCTSIRLCALKSSSYPQKLLITAADKRFRPVNNGIKR